MTRTESTKIQDMRMHDSSDDPITRGMITSSKERYRHSTSVTDRRTKQSFAQENLNVPLNAKMKI